MYKEKKAFLIIYPATVSYYKDRGATRQFYKYFNHIEGFGTTLFLLSTTLCWTIQARGWQQQQVSQANSSCGSEKRCSDQSFVANTKKMIWYQYISWYLSVLGLCLWHTSAITRSQTWCWINAQRDWLSLRCWCMKKMFTVQQFQHYGVSNT